MQPEVKLFFEKIQADINYVSDYIRLILDEKVDLDISQVGLINYSQYDFFKKSINSDIKQQIENDNALATQARVRKDFIEFCRCICLQLELLMSHFFLDTRDDPQSLRSRFTRFTKIVENSSQDNQNTKEQIYLAIDIRNVASHRDTSGFPIERRIKKKGNKVCLYLNQLSQISEEEMKKKLTNFLSNENWDDVRVTYKKDGRNGGYAYVYLSGVELNLSDYEAKSTVEQLIRTVYPQLGRNVTVDFNRKQSHQNQLYPFFIESDYDKLQQAFLWVLKEFDKLSS